MKSKTPPTARLSSKKPFPLQEKTAPSRKKKLKHWCGFQGIFGRKSAPVLEFIFITLPERSLSGSLEGALRLSNTIR
jgi:hypothetical protein